jgi:peptide/nickel transport system substrate-binding protein
VLDPARGGTFAGRIVFAAMCDKLVDIDEHLNFVPQLATAWSWSDDNLALTLHLRDGAKFQDGTPVDAQAVRASLDHARTAPDSARRTELKPIDTIEVVDPHTLRLHLTQPYAPLLAVLADRAGMVTAPGPDANHPVCAGPFRLRERVAQDHITLDRFPEYWNAAAIHFDRIDYRIIPDTTVRLANLKAGQLDLVERLGPTDVAQVKADPQLRLASGTAVAYRTLTINVGNGAGANTPLGRDPRVREAFEKAIDRDALNQVVMDGLFVPGNQAEAPNTRFWNPDRPTPPRDVAGAKALLRAAGLDRVPVTLSVENTPTEAQTGQVIQSMAAEAGFDVTLRVLEPNALVAAAQRGDYQAAVVLWSGRADPDFNVSIFLACDGGQNWGHYCNPAFDKLLAQARAVTDPAERQALYRQVSDTYLNDRPDIFLYHLTWLFAHNARLDGFHVFPDGLIRPQGLQMRGG